MEWASRSREEVRVLVTLRCVTKTANTRLDDIERGEVFLANFVGHSLARGR